MVKDFKSGDLVYWNEWKIVNKKLQKLKKFGVFIEKKVKFVSHREVVYGIVLCSETGNTIQVLGVRLKKK